MVNQLAGGPVNPKNLQPYLQGDWGGAPTMGAWHWQEKPPLVLTQSELAPHTPGVRAHSSTSAQSAPWVNK